MSNTEKIKSLDGLKVLALLLIFRQHYAVYGILIPDQAARAVELFFCVSGFLTAYRHLPDNLPLTWKESAGFALTRAAKFFPLHLTAFLIVVLFAPAGRFFTAENLVKAFLNIFLLQAWSPNESISFSFNVSSWYLSALMFCLFLTPVLLATVRKAKRPAVLFLFAFVGRFACSYLTERYPGEFFSFRTYTFPPSRCLEYFMGMAMFPIYGKVKIALDKIKTRNRAMICSVAETGILAVTVLIYFRGGGYVFAPICVFMACAVVFTLALQGGAISKFLSLRPFAWFSSVQTEFFLLHLPVINIVQRMELFKNHSLAVLFCFAAALLLSWVYRRFLSATLTSAVGKAIEKVLRNEK